MKCDYKTKQHPMFIDHIQGENQFIKCPFCDQHFSSKSLKMPRNVKHNTRLFQKIQNQTEVKNKKNLKTYNHRLPTIGEEISPVLSFFSAFSHDSWFVT